MYIYITFIAILLIVYLPYYINKQRKCLNTIVEVIINQKLWKLLLAERVLKGNSPFGKVGFFDWVYEYTYELNGIAKHGYVKFGKQEQWLFDDAEFVKEQSMNEDVI
ncbi:MAG: hypothetical protein H7Y41_04130 [Hyphomonadaceae bacterium]|nr:hypothetical protein [Clostridia bacterium]